MEERTVRLIAKLSTSVQNVRNATNAAQRDAARGFMIKRARDLCERRDDLLAKIEAGWAWLEDYPVHDPAVAKQEDQFFAWNVELRAITDALDAAEGWTVPAEVA